MTDQNTEAQERQEKALTRAEWMSAFALIGMVLQGAYLAGVEMQRLNDHDRRLSNIETAQVTSSGKVEQLLITVSRIDANVTALAERAQEQRGLGK